MYKKWRLKRALSYVSFLFTSGVKEIMSHAPHVHTSSEPIWTYKQYTHVYYTDVYWVQEIHEHIKLKEYILSIYAVSKKKILFLLCPEKKNSLALRLWKKIMVPRMYVHIKTFF